jgi:catechol 2,3-dioxygenase-like lactoylglutathione lyase family enzyme
MKDEGGRRKAEGGRRKAEGGGRKAEGGGMKGGRGDQNGIRGARRLTRRGDATIAVRMSSPTLRIAHGCIIAPDLAAVLRFYGEGFGMRKVFRFLRQEKEIGFYLDAGGGTFLEFFVTGEARPVAPAPLDHLCLEVASVAGTAANLRALGYTVTGEKLGADQSWQAWVTDPAGTRIELHEYTAESSQRTGRDCQVDW